MPVRRLNAVVRAKVVAGGLLTWLVLPGAWAACVSVSPLVSFNGYNGASPYAGLMQGSDGSLYGATVNGGTGFVGPGTGYGTLYRITAGGSFANLVWFNGTNGANPYSPPTQGADGNFYGVTARGGSNGLGVVYRLATNNTLTAIFSFGGTNGALPYGALVQGTDGALYGTTAYGGSSFLNGVPTSGSGTVFKVTTNGTLTSLVMFNSVNGARPIGSLVQAADGFLYGTTVSGGTNGNWGSLFRVATGGTAFASLFSFNGTNGANPFGGLIQGANGLLYGTTSYGGGDFNNTPSSGDGTIFQITTNGVLQTLFLFSGGVDGWNPSWAKLVQGPDGSLYGTTFRGGTNGMGGSGNGVAFQLGTNGVLNTLLTFDPLADNGISPYGGLILGANDSLYGTASSGGVANSGTAFRLTPAATLQDLGYSGSTFTFGCAAFLGTTYQAQYKTDPAAGNWNNLGGPVLASSPFVTWSDPTAADSSRIYRVIVTLPP